MGQSERPTLAKIISWERRLNALVGEMQESYPENQEPRFVRAADIAWLLIYTKAGRMQNAAVEES